MPTKKIVTNIPLELCERAKRVMPAETFTGVMRRALDEFLTAHELQQAERTRLLRLAHTNGDLTV